jgi:hypothetical protein
MEWNTADPSHTTAVDADGRFIAWVEEYWHKVTQRDDHAIVCRFVVQNAPHAGKAITQNFNLTGNGTGHTKRLFEACNDGKPVAIGNVFDPVQLSKVIGRRLVCIEVVPHSFQGERRLKVAAVDTLTKNQRAMIAHITEGVEEGESICVDAPKQTAPKQRNTRRRDDSEGWDETPHPADR